MRFDLDQLVLLGLLSASIHWLAARASITKWFWSLGWYPIRNERSVLTRDFLARLFACAACSGFWIGLGLGFAGVRPIGEGWRGIVASGLVGIFVTPVFEGLLLWGLERTHLDP
jgi:hypothetical protein